MSDPHIYQKKAPDLLALEPQMFVIHYADAGNQSWVLRGRAASAHNTKPSLQPVTHGLLEGMAPQSDLFVSGSAPS